MQILVLLGLVHAAARPLDRFLEVIVLLVGPGLRATLLVVNFEVLLKFTHLRLIVGVAEQRILAWSLGMKLLVGGELLYNALALLLGVVFHLAEDPCPV